MLIPEGHLSWICYDDDISCPLAAGFHVTLHHLRCVTQENKSYIQHNRVLWIFTEQMAL